MNENHAAGAAEPVSFLNPKLAARSRAGRPGPGVFCLQPVQPDELLAVWGGRVLSEQQLGALPPEQKDTAFPVEDGLYLAPIGAPEPANFFNHSCEPNAGLRGQIALVARRVIATDEEVCLDYAMYARASQAGTDCRCGAAACRGRINRQDWRNPELWDRYAGCFSPFIQRRIDLLRAGRESGALPVRVLSVSNEPDRLPTHYLSPKLTAGKASQPGQNGVFAKEWIRAGEILTVWGGVIVSSQRLAEFDPYQQLLAVQVEEGLHLAPFDSPEPADYFNHSCNPNAGLNGQNCLVALRPIRPGEEVCFDYATSDSTPYDEFECGCGEPGCRGKISAQDWQRPELIQRYQGYFSPYLQQRIQRS